MIQCTPSPNSVREQGYEYPQRLIVFSKWTTLTIQHDCDEKLCVQQPILFVCLGCLQYCVNSLSPVNYFNQRPRADLNRDRWIQSPEC